MTQPLAGVDAAMSSLDMIVDIARQHREAGRLTEAVALLQAVVRITPENGRARYQLGLALLTGANPEGTDHLVAAVRLNPTDADCRADLAAACDAMGDVRGALTLYRRLMSLVADRADLIVRFGQSLARSGDDVAAQRWIRRSFALDAANGPGYRSLAEIQRHAGQAGKALGTLYRAIAADPDDGENHLALALPLKNSGAPPDQVMRPARLAADRLPHRQDVVMPVVQHLRDNGDEDAAVRYATSFISRHMDEVARDDIGRYGFRMLTPANLVTRYGEMAYQLDLHVKMKLLGWLPPFISILTVPPGTSFNRALLEYWRPHVTIVEDPELIARLEPLRSRLSFNTLFLKLPDGRVFSKARAYFAVQEEWIRQGRGPLVRLSHRHVERGQAELRRMGVPAGAWFACVHVREPGYLKEGPNSSESARNGDIRNYIPAIEEIVRRGGWAIRIGDPTMAPLPPLPQCIDYAVSPFKSEEMDVFLAASCRFLLGTTSGVVLISEVFGVPVGAAEYYPIGGMLHTQLDVIIPKPYREKASGRMLHFEEYLKMPLAFTYDSNHFASLGLEALPSEPEDIRELAIEMLERTEGKWPYDAEDERLNARWHELCRPFTLGQVGCRVGRGFLRRHRHLFQSL